MLNNEAIALASELGLGSCGVFRGRDFVTRGGSPKQLSVLCAAGVLSREYPGVYRLTAVAPSAEQRLRAALLWAGDTAAARGPSAGWAYKLDGVQFERAEIVVPATRAIRSDRVVVHQAVDLAPLMVRTVRGMRVTGVEATLVALAHALDGEAFELACEDARRRKLTSVSALRAYLTRFGRRGLPGLAATRALLDELDPVHPSRSTLEVKTRRLLVANGMTGFEREFPLEWKGRTYRFDFACRATRTILETNGRRWHDDPTDYEHDNEKCSVPGRHGYRLVFATWAKVTQNPRALIEEIAAARAARVS